MTFDKAQLPHAAVQKQSSFHRIAALLFGAVALIFAGWANADPPTRVARLSYISGAVSFSPAGENDWVEAGINRPLISGDRLWVDSGSRAELQIGSAVFHLGGSTSVKLLNLDNRVAQLEVEQGTVNARVRRLGAREVVEIDTPNLAYSIRKPGGYRVDVDAGRDTTTVATRSGQAEVFGEGASYLVNAGQDYRFYGNNLRDYDNLEPLRGDDFDRWADERNRRGDNSASARYVSRDVIGYEDLDEHGSWRRDAGYGNVWVPNRVPSGWAPYRDGHWSWVEPWGWTWVDDAPWGFAVSHYGRWANMNGTWGWVPGPAKTQPVYAPALVAFIGGVIAGAAISNSNVGWFPLGPRDVYRPSYPVSRGYFNNVNRSNTTINNTTITNVYNTKVTNVTNITYVNQRVPGAVVAMPANDFRQARHVGKSRVEMSREAVAKAQVTQVAAVAPDRASVHGGRDRGRTPPERAQTRPVVAKEKPPAPPVSFAARERRLEKRPGRPLDAAELKGLKPTVPAAAVKVVAPPAKPAAAPPSKPPGEAGKGRDPEKGRAPDARKGGEAEKGRRPDAKGGEAEKGRGADARKGGEAEKGRAPDAGKGTPPADAEKGRPSDARKGPSDADKGRPADTKKGAPDADKGRPADAPKGTPPADAEKGRPSDTKKGPPDAEKGRPADTKKGTQPPEAEKGRPTEAPKGTPPADADKGRQADDRKGGRRGDAQKDSPFDGRKGRQPEAPQPPEPAKAAPPVSAPRPPEPPKAPPPEERKAAPPVNVPRPPEPPKAPAPEERRGRPEVPRPPEQPKAAPPEERRGRPDVPRPPETPRAPPAEERKAAPPPVAPPRAPEPPKAPPREERKAPPPPEPPKAPPPPVQRPPEPPKAPPPPPVQRPPEPPKAPPAPAPRPPEPPKAPPAPPPRPPEPPKAPPPEARKAEAGKSEPAKREERRDKKGDDDDRKK